MGRRDLFHRSRLLLDDITEGAPPPVAGSFRGAIASGALGGVVGLIVGLFANPGTAWFAVFELGVPAAILGGVVGFLAGAAAWVFGRGRTD